MKLPQGYYDCAKKMGQAAELWLKTNPSAKPLLRLPPEKVGLICGLDQATKLFACNDAAREFFQFIDKATHGQGTAMQMCAVIRALGLPATELGLGELIAMGAQVN